MSASRKTQRMLHEIHRNRLDADTRGHRAALEEELVPRHEELYGQRQRAERPARERRFRHSLRLAAATLTLMIVALAAAAIPIDHQVPLGQVIILEADHREIPPLSELLETAQRLTNAASVSVDVAEREGGATVTVLLLGEADDPTATTSSSDRLVDALRRLDPRFGSETVSSRELIGVFPRSVGEVLGRKLFAVELGAGELAAARREILAALGATAADVEIEAGEAGGRRVLEVRIEPLE